MGISHYQELINSCNERITNLKNTNSDLSAQEENQKKLLNAKDWATYYLEKALRNQKNKMYTFLRENGGLFNLNEEQQAHYSQMMLECNNISSNWMASRSDCYKLKQGITAISIGISSNYSSILNETFDIGDYKNQLSLFSHINQT